MKKTLTVNLGGTVYHIDDDAYQLLDRYLCNLRLYFRKEEGAEEIINDIELRISELFSEKVNLGYQVISIGYVEEVIKQMGKPEDISGEENAQKSGYTGPDRTHASDNRETPRHRFYRDPDNKVLGGIAGGLAAYLGWDATPIRLILFVLMICGVGTLVPIYIVLWLIIPMAHTAAEKLAMRGESINMENIGRTVTDGFQRMTDEMNSYVESGRPRSFLQKMGDLFVQVLGICLKIVMVVLAVAFSPVLFILVIVFVALIFAVCTGMLEGGAFLCHLLPSFNWDVLTCPPTFMFLFGIAGILIVGIPLVGLLYSIFRQLFNWGVMSSALKWVLVALWIISFIGALVLLSQMTFPVFPLFF